MNTNDLKQIDELLQKRLKGFATKDDLKRLATKDDLKNFATKNDLKHLEKRIEDHFDDRINEVIQAVDKNKADRSEVIRLEEKIKQLEL